MYPEYLINKLNFNCKGKHFWCWNDKFKFRDSFNGYANGQTNGSFRNIFNQLRFINYKTISSFKYCYTFAVYYFTNTLNQQ